MESFDELEGLKRGHVRIAAIEALAEGIIMKTIAKLTLEYPTVCLWFDHHAEDAAKFAIEAAVQADA